jgi:hypothetical protein
MAAVMVMRVLMTVMRVIDIWARWLVLGRVSHLNMCCIVLIVILILSKLGLGTCHALQVRSLLLYGVRLDPFFELSWLTCLPPMWRSCSQLAGAHKVARYCGSVT